jgi:hypothetical protein
MDLKNLFSRKKNDGTEEPKTIKSYLPIIIIILLLIITVCVHFFLVNPEFEEQQVMIDDMYYKLGEIDNMNSQITGLEKQVEELTLAREIKFNLFVSEQEVEDLYQLISFTALRNKLKVKRLIRGEEQAVRENVPAGQDAASIPADYFKIFVEYDIEGKFPDYLKLKQEIAKLDKLIVFEKEEVKTTASGSILAAVKISLVRMPTR